MDQGPPSGSWFCQSVLWFWLFIHSFVCLLYCFLIFCMKLWFIKHIKLIEPIFWWIWLLCPKSSKWCFLGPKSRFLKFSLNLCIRFSWNYIFNRFSCFNDWNWILGKGFGFLMKIIILLEILEMGRFWTQTQHWTLFH